jgi:glucarate dehydratase
MRIEELVVTPIALGDPPLLNAGGVHAPWALRIVLELVTESGIIGLSEIPGDVDVLGGLRRVAPELRGKSVYDLSAIRTVLTESLGEERPEARGDRPWDSRRLVHAVSSLEVACLDAIGKKLDCRVVDLLGGARRASVPYSAYLFFKYDGAGGTLGDARHPSERGWWAARQLPALDPDGLVAQARAMMAEFGFASLKVKAGILEPDLEVNATLALREAFGKDIPIRIDPNAAWSFETALAQGERLRPVIEYYEDPVRGQEEMGALRKRLDIPLATNMCTTSFEDLPRSLALGSEDILLADHHFWGGLRASLELARICDTFGRALSMHSNSHAGISFAAMTHLGAALPNLRYALDTHYPWQKDEIVAGGKLPIRDGAVAVPDGPGLGVELDRGALALLNRRYEESGLLRRDDEVEMQKRVPGWRFVKTRY